MKQLTPLHLRESYYDEVEKEINKLFYSIFYEPIIESLRLRKKEITNSTDGLRDAILSGNIWFENNKFHGKFNAKLSKELKSIGATYSASSRTWTLLKGLPPDLVLVNVAAQNMFKEVQKNVLNTINSMDTSDINAISDIPDVYISTLGKINGDFEKTLGKSIAIAPKLTQESLNVIAADWGYNLDLYVKGWLDENIISMRKAIQENTFDGRRSSDMIGFIRDNYGVSTRKARFLARQETSLLMAKFKEDRYDSIGVKKYRWSTSKDERTRDDHEFLNGKVFTFDNPPITNKKTGARNNPTEDYGCRCVAIPLID